MDVERLDHQAVEEAFSHKMLIGTSSSCWSLDHQAVEEALL
jgi:hypothetical protein